MSFSVSFAIGPPTRYDRADRSRDRAGSSPHLCGRSLPHPSAIARSRRSIAYVAADRGVRFAPLMTKLVHRRRPRGPARGPGRSCCSTEALEVVGAAGNVAAGVDLVDARRARRRDRRHPAARRQRHRPDAPSCSPGAPTSGVILYTGDSDAELLYDGLDSGARGYALKDGLDGRAASAAIERGRRRRHLRRPAAGPRPAVARAPPRSVPQLSPREREIMDLMAEGLTGEAIGDEISVSVETVRTHVRNVIRKLAGAQPRARDRDRARARRDRAGLHARRAMSAEGTGRLADRPDERLARLVHDLRTPLTIVQGFAELLDRGDATLDEERRAGVPRPHRRGRARDEGHPRRRARGPAVGSERRARRLDRQAASGGARRRRGGGPAR